jgi:shikimate dehydrogenase
MNKKFGVIGYPIGHTMSPFIHQELFKLRGVSADYLKYKIESENLGEVFSSCLKNLDGFNITIPHKIAIMGFCDVIDPSAAEYGAVNTVCRKDGKYYGYNTDAYGFLMGLSFSGINLSGRVLVYGCGGAARTIISECLKAGCDVTVGTTTDRLEKTSDTVKEIEKKQGKKINVITKEEISEKYDLMVNTTPVGMYPNGGISPLSEEQISLMDSVYDIVYNPAETELLKIARKLGKTCGGGLSMLVCQAQKSQYYWLGAEFTDEETEKVIKSAEAELERVFGK